MKEEDPADAPFGSGRLGEVLAERQRILRLVAGVVTGDNLAVQEGSFPGTLVQASLSRAESAAIGEVPQGGSVVHRRTVDAIMGICVVLQ